MSGSRGWLIYDEFCFENNDCASLNCANNKCKEGTAVDTWCDDYRVCKSLNCDLVNKKCLTFGKLNPFEGPCYFDDACQSRICDSKSRECKFSECKNCFFFSKQSP